MKKQNNPSIKAHLIRSMLYVLLLVAICVIPFALAQRNDTSGSAATPATNATASSATSIRSAAILPHPRAPQIVLHDQYNGASAAGTLSSSLSDFPAFSSDAADDFVIPAGQTWNVQSVDADGMYMSGVGPAASFNVFFYADNAGLPGAQVYSALNQPFSVAGSTFTVNLPTAAVLSRGTYWVEIQANMMFVPNGAWGWTDRTVQSNQLATWQNAGGGFGVSPIWTLKTTSVPTAGGPDHVFRLNGMPGGVTPTPTASPTATATATATPK